MVNKNDILKIKKLINKEKKRQNETLMMIPSENYASEEVLKALSSPLSNKYSEGYPGKRYYQGNEIIDEIETLAIEKAKQLFNVPHANVQPYSGSPANAEVYFALLEHADKILGMALPFGGHLTHGHPNVTLSGKYFNTIQYETNKNGFIDYEQVRKLARKHKPKIIISGTSAYPRKIDFRKFGKIADEVRAYHLADISHIAGLVIGGQHQSPARHAHIITTTTHKTLKGPRGAIIMVTNKGLKKNPKLDEMIDKAVFPGMQGGPHNSTTAAIAIALSEASSPEFIKYAAQIIKNSKALAKELKKFDFDLVTDGTDNHLILIDITNKDLNGWEAAWALEYAGIIINKNTIPFDKKPPYYPSGIRLGTPAITTKGLKEKDMKKISKLINKTIEIAQKIKKNDESINKEKLKLLLNKNAELKNIKKEVEKLVC